MALLSESRPEWGIAYLGISGSGLVAVPIQPDSEPAWIERVLSHAECSAVLASEALAGRLPRDPQIPFHLLDIAESIRGPELDPVGDDLEADPVPVEWDAIRAPEEGDLAALLYAPTGAGGLAGAMLSHRALAYGAWAASLSAPLRPGESVLSLLPPSDPFGFSVAFLSPFLCGGSIFCAESPASALVSVLARLRPSRVVAAPSAVEELARERMPLAFSDGLPRAASPLRSLFRYLAAKAAASRVRKDLGGRLRILVLGDGPLDPRVGAFLDAAGFPYAKGSGLAGAAPVVSLPAPGMAAPPSVLLPLKGLQLRLDPEAGSGPEGEVQLKGPAVMEGYFKEPELSRRAFSSDGWLRTGIRGRLGSAGRILMLPLAGAAARGENGLSRQFEATAEGVKA